MELINPSMEAGNLGAVFPSPVALSSNHNIQAARMQNIADWIPYREQDLVGLVEKWKTALSDPAK
jgi:hypothetical protein